VLSTSSGWNSRINGHAFFSSPSNWVSFSSAPVLGAHNYPFDGNIAEFLIFDRGLTPAERDTVGFYLNNRYTMISSLPTAPSNITAQAISSTAMNVSWSSGSTNETSFIIERAIGSGGTYAVQGVVSSGTTNFVDTLASDSAAYYYRVKSDNYVGASSYCSPMAPPTSTITNPASSSVFTVGANCAVGATATDPDGTVSKVDFYRDSVFFVATNSVPYTGTVTNLGLFSRSITAKATDNQGNTRISMPLILAVYPDTDSDGTNNAQEILIGTDPTIFDSPWVGGTNSPVINLLEPTNAVKLP
jgi:hypothetical protein